MRLAEYEKGTKASDHLKEEKIEKKGKQKEEDERGEKDARRKGRHKDDAEKGGRGMGERREEEREA